MKSSIAREEAEFSKFLSYDEEEDFDREMQKIEKEKAEERNAKRKTFEPDVTKWEGTGLEDEVIKVQRDQSEPVVRRLEEVRAQVRTDMSDSQINEIIDSTFRYTNPVDKRKKTKATDTENRVTGSASAAKILTGPPNLKNISQTSNLANNMNIVKPEPLFSKSTTAATKKVAQYMTLDGPVTYEPGPARKQDAVTQGALNASYTSVSSHLRASE